MSQQLPGTAQTGGAAAGGQAQDNLVNVGAQPIAVGGNGPGGGHVGVVGIVLLITYLVIFTLLLIYGLVKVWPVPTPSREPTTETTAATASPSPSPMVSPAAAQASPAGVRSPAPTPSPQTAGNAGQPSASPKPAASPAASPLPEPVAIGFFGFQFRLWDEQRLLLLVLLAGALGSILHDLRSVYWYVGNRSLVRSWMAMYIVLPFAGATLALIFYLVVRGGFFSPQSSFKETSPFGFAAFAALIGMFSPQAVLKLREVAETLLTKPAHGANAKPQEAVHPPNVPANVSANVPAAVEKEKPQASPPKD